MINREDMLELSRRMTPARNHFVRLAGAYIDEEGYIDGTFQTNFKNLKGAELSHCLDIAKTLPLAETNKELVSYQIPRMKSGSIWQLLYAIRDCELKNDALLLNLYEIIAENYPVGKSYGIYVYYGVYDVPVKAEDKEWLEGSEEVYQYLLLTISPTDEELTPELPVTGLIYPAFADRSTDIASANVYTKEGNLSIINALK